MEKIKAVFYNAEGIPRWELIVPIIVVLGFLLWYYFKVLNYAPKPNCTDDNQPTNGNANTNGNTNSNGSNPVINQSSITDFQGFVTQLHTGNTKTYWAGCSGNFDKGERCDNFKEFLKMTDVNQRLVAEIYKEKFNKTLYSDVNAIWACDCMESWGTITGKVLERLEQLGLK